MFNDYLIKSTQMAVIKAFIAHWRINTGMATDQAIVVNFQFPLHENCLPYMLLGLDHFLATIGG